MTLFIIVGLIASIAAGDKGDIRKGYRYSKTVAPVEEVSSTTKAKEITKIPIRQRTKKPVAGILYAPTSTVTEKDLGYKYTKNAIVSSEPSSAPPTISTTKHTLPPVETTHQILTSSSASATPVQSTTFKTSSSVQTSPKTSSQTTTGYSYKPSQAALKLSSQQPNGYTYKSSSLQPRAAVTLGYKQSQTPLVSSTSTASRRSGAVGKGYRYNSNNNSVSKSVVTNEPQTTQTVVTKKAHRSRGGYKYKIPEGIKPTDDGYVYKKVVKRQ